METVAPAAAPPSPSQAAPPPSVENKITSSQQSREEGEVSSSNDDDDGGFPSGPASQPTNRCAVISDPVEIYSTQAVVSGNSAPTNHPSSFTAPSSSSAPPNLRKASEKNHVPFVISFSDDSGSDSESFKQRTVVESKINSKPLDRSQMSRQNAANNPRKFPRKRSLSRTFVPPTNTFNATSSRNGLPFRLRSRLKDPSITHDNKIGPNVHLDFRKLQDLRQLIAIRENELKFKASKNINETGSRSCEKNLVMDVRDGSSNSKDLESGILLNQPNEQEMKRRKVNEPLANTVSADEGKALPATKHLTTGKHLIEDRVQQLIEDHSSCDKEVQLFARQSRANQQMKKVKIFEQPSEIQTNGRDIIKSKGQCSWTTKSVVPSTAVVEKTSRISPENLRAATMKDLGEPYSWRDTVPIPVSVPNKSFPKEATYEQTLMQTYNKSDECPNYTSFHSSLDFANISSNFQSLLDMEELQDKELEDAQEHRHKCEIEERNALKAYRRAQRAVAEANARCSYLYRKRELFSAHLRSRMMEDSSLFWPTRQNYNETGLDSLANISDENANVPPQMHHQTESEIYLQNQPHYKSNIRSENGPPRTASDPIEDGEILSSDRHTETDDSTSDPPSDNDAVNGMRSLSNDIDISAEEQYQGTFPFHIKADQSSLDCQRKEKGCDEKPSSLNDEPNSFDDFEDSLLLEASLRSQLFARLGIKNSQKKSSSQSMDSTVEREAQNDNGGETIESPGDIPPSEAERNQNADFEDINRPPKDIKNQDHFESSSTGDPSQICSMKSAILSCPIPVSNFVDVNAPADVNSAQLPSRDLQIDTSNTFESRSFKDSNSLQLTVMNMRDTAVGSCASDLAVNPFWPLCMYELRGKCNDDECTWQHVRDYSNTADSLTLQKENSPAGLNISKFLDNLPLAPPTYLVCLDVLKADVQPYRRILTQSVGQRWKKCFSAFLVVSNILPSEIGSEEPSLHGPETRVEVQGSWKRQLSYFRGGSYAMSQLERKMVDHEQVLEMAVLNHNREFNKQKGRLETLKVLARALEKDPTSVVLWLVYLCIFYSNQNMTNKDDWFRVAVEHNEGSYDLWILYINSRVKLDDRLLAYERALSTLCRQSSPPDNNAIPGSQLILDLFLQMMNCLCISGEVGKAVQKISTLLPYAKCPSGPDLLSLPDLYACLNICDKFVFWICCVYLFMYNKLPVDVVRQFECKKELSEWEWPLVTLTNDEKLQAAGLANLAVNSLSLYADNESLGSTTVKTAQMFALNHIKCMQVLEGLECSKILLEKYLKLYPSCVELVLMSVRIRECGSGDGLFAGFEEAVGNWKFGVPGVHSIWSQYVKSALQNGKPELAKTIMERWFHSVWEAECSSFCQADDVFGLLNLSLHKLLQNDHMEARLAVERAMEAASAEDYKQCVLEHTMFMLKAGLLFDANNPVSGVLNILDKYLMDSRFATVPQPLSRSFLETIKKPRVRDLVNSLFSPVSPSFTLLNSVLEIIHGPSLIPQEFCKLKDMVDYVETIIGMIPGNYELAISLGKLLSKNVESIHISASVRFWACSILIDSLFQAVPVAPEYVWLEAAGVLHTLTDIQAITNCFHKRALSVHPFSLKLWKSYLSSSRNEASASRVTKEAEERGTKLT